MGWPMEARWTLIWWVRPVRGFNSRSETSSPVASSFISFSTFHFVIAARLSFSSVRRAAHRFGDPDVRTISATTCPELIEGCPYTQATYVFSIFRSLNCCFKYRYISGVFAMIITPLVDRSNRCTIPGSGMISPCGETQGSPTAASAGYLVSTQSATLGSRVLPSRCTMSPAGLLSTTTSAVSASTSGTTPYPSICLA